MVKILVYFKGLHHSSIKSFLIYFESHFVSQVLRYYVDEQMESGEKQFKNGSQVTESRVFFFEIMLSIRKMSK